MLAPTDIFSLELDSRNFGSFWGAEIWIDKHWVMEADLYYFSFPMPPVFGGGPTSNFSGKTPLEIKAALKNILYFMDHPDKAEDNDVLKPIYGNETFFSCPYKYQLKSRKSEKHFTIHATLEALQIENSTTLIELELVKLHNLILLWINDQVESNIKLFSQESEKSDSSNT